MSSKKDKFLESAQKFIVKGQLDRAVKDYEQVVALDPGDIKQRQRLAELLVRVNRSDDAISEYETIGKYYTDNGFTLKAIAVYKQIQRIAPDNSKITLTLAELNVVQGLIGNALAEFNQVVTYLINNEIFGEAIKVLERMREVDPANLNTLLKIAETCHSAGKFDESYEYFIQLARFLTGRTDKSAFTRLCERVTALFPDKGAMPFSMIATLLDRGESADAIAILKEYISIHPDNPDAWHLLLDAVRASGDLGQLRQVLAKICQRFPEETRPREEYIQLAIHEEDLESALELLHEHRGILLREKRIEQLESFYSSLHEMAPLDSRPQEGLSWLYIETGNKKKLAEVVAKSNHQPIVPEPGEEQPLPSDESPQEEPGTEALSPGMPDYRDIPLPPDLPATEPPAIETSSMPVLEPAWEEEIDLGLEEEFAEPAGFPESTPEQGLTLPLEESTAELSPVVPDESMFEEAEFVPAVDIEESPDWEMHEPDRVSLTIREPLPIEAFLSHQNMTSTVPSPQAEEPARDSLPPISGKTSTEDEPPSFLDEGSLAEEFPFLSLADENETAPADGQEAFWLEKTQPTGLPVSGPLDDFPADQAETSVQEPFFSDDDFPDLSDILSPENAPCAEATNAGLSNKYNTAAILTSFKKGVDQQLDKEDTESHYNLGIAYKEMGLFDDAVAEFLVASSDPGRAADCAMLVGLCWRDKGNISAAEEAFNAGVAIPGISGDALRNLKYELAYLYELSSRNQEAMNLYSEIVHAAPGFRDAAARIVKLSGEELHDIQESELASLNELGKQ